MSISLPPVLVGNHITGGASHTVIDLEFSEPIERGSGYIIVTDGALQTVIDRATGLPTLRVVGATQTYQIPLNLVGIDGTHATINADGLTPGHQYSVYMAPGVLVSNGKPFAGVTGAAQLSFVAADDQGPTLAGMSLDNHQLGAGTNATLTLKFSEAVSFDPSALTVPNATLSGWGTSDGGVTWHANLAAQRGVTAPTNLLQLDMSAVHDSAGNAGSGTSSVSYSVDTTAPTLSSIAISGATPVLNASSTVTLVFSEPVHLDPAALGAPYANIHDWQSADNITWTASLTPQSGTTASGNSLTLNMAMVTDMSGNAGSGTVNSPNTYAVDTQGPGATIALSGGQITPTGSVLVTITFSEPVQPLTADMISAPNANIVNLHALDGGLTWSAELVPDGSGASSIGNMLTLDLGKVHDMAGNTGIGTSSAPAPYDVDVHVPLTASVTLDGAQLLTGGSTIATITFSEPVANFSLEQISAPNATLFHLHTPDEGTTWYVEVEPQAGGIYANTNALSFDLSKVVSNAGHSGSGTAVSGNYVVDTMVSSYVESFIMLSADNGYSPFDLVTNDSGTGIVGHVYGTMSASAKLELSVDGTLVDPAAVIMSPDSSPSGSSYTWVYQGAAPLAEGVHTISARIVDGAHSSAVASADLTIDTTAPKMISASPEAAPFDVSKSIVITFDDQVYWRPVFTPDVETGAAILHQDDNRIKLVDKDGAVLWIPISMANLSADGKTLTISANELQLATGTSYDLTLPAALTDLAGNAVVSDHTVHFTTTGVFTDSIAPHALAAVVENEASIYGIGQSIMIDVQFDEPMKLVGDAKPTLTLNNGATATFDWLSDDGRTAYFDYSVGANDKQPTDNPQGWIDLAGTDGLAGCFTDLAGNALTADHIAFTKLGELTGQLPGSGIGIDTTVPNALAAPVMDSAMDTGVIGDFITSISTPVIHGSGADPYNTIDVYDIVNGYRDWVGYTTPDSNGNWTFDLKNAFGEGVPFNLGDGVHQLVVVQTEGSGNESPESVPLQFTVDTQAMAPLVSPLGSGSDTGTTGDWITAVRQPTLEGTAEAGATIEVLDGTQSKGTTVAGADGSWTFAFKADLADGVHSLAIRQTDVTGNTSELALQALAIDTAAPGALTGLVLDAASDSGYLQNDGITNALMPKFDGSGAEANATIELYEGDKLVGSTTSNQDGSWQVQYTSADTLLDGDHAFCVRQVDAAGNAGPKSAAIKVTIDTAAPTVEGWTNNVPLGGNFEIWFSEPVVHSGLTNYAAVDDSITGTLFNFPLGDSNSWTDNVMRNGHLTSVWHFMPSHNGWVELTLTGVQDAAGNVATIPLSHHEFTVPLTAVAPQYLPVL